MKRGAGARKERGAQRAAPTLSVPQAAILAAAVVLVVGGLAGFAVYRDRIRPLQTKVLTVDDLSVDMRYFLKRVRTYGREPLEVLELLTRELIVTQVAPHPPYNIEVTEQDVDDRMRDAARAGADSITGAEMREWLRQAVNDSELTEAEFREVMRRNLLALRMTEYLGERMPTVAEQVRLYLIAFASPAAGAAVVAQLEAGADFLELARSEANADERLRAAGGDLGWLPRQAMRPELAAVFDLPAGQPSPMLALDGDAYAVAMVGERAAARELDPAARQAAKTAALTAWFKQEYRRHDVEVRGFTNGYDTETDLWVKWQLQRMARQRS